MYRDLLRSLVIADLQIGVDRQGGNNEQNEGGDGGKVVERGHGWFLLLRGMVRSGNGGKLIGMESWNLLRYRHVFLTGV